MGFWIRKIICFERISDETIWLYMQKEFGKGSLLLRRSAVAGQRMFAEKGSSSLERRRRGGWRIKTVFRVPSLRCGGKVHIYQFGDRWTTLQHGKEELQRHKENQKVERELLSKEGRRPSRKCGSYCMLSSSIHAASLQNSPTPRREKERKKNLCGVEKEKPAGENWQPVWDSGWKGQKPELKQEEDEGKDVSCLFRFELWTSVLGSKVSKQQDHSQFYLTNQSISEEKENRRRRGKAGKGVMKKQKFNAGNHCRRAMYAPASLGRAAPPQQSDYCWVKPGLPPGILWFGRRWLLEEITKHMSRKDQWACRYRGHEVSAPRSSGGQSSQNLGQPITSRLPMKKLLCGESRVHRRRRVFPKLEIRGDFGSWPAKIIRRI